MVSLDGKHGPRAGGRHKAHAPAKQAGFKPGLAQGLAGGGQRENDKPVLVRSAGQAVKRGRQILNEPGMPARLRAKRPQAGFGGGDRGGKMAGILSGAGHDPHPGYDHAAPHEIAPAFRITAKL